MSDTEEKPFAVPFEGECPECGRVVPLNRDGALKLHNRRYILSGQGGFRRPCPYGRKPQPQAA
jgi:hypothetical protein